MKEKRHYGVLTVSFFLSLFFLNLIHPLFGTHVHHANPADLHSTRSSHGGNRAVDCHNRASQNNTHCQDVETPLDHILEESAHILSVPSVKKIVQCTSTTPSFISSFPESSDTDYNDYEYPIPYLEYYLSLFTHSPPRFA